MNLILETLRFTPSEMDGRTDIEITMGQFSGVKYNYGRVWFPDENSPQMSFEYDVVSENKPGDLVKADFEQLIGEILVETLRKAIAEESVVYSGGTDEVESPKIFTGE